MKFLFIITTAIVSIWLMHAENQDLKEKQRETFQELRECRALLNVGEM